MKNLLEKLLQTRLPQSFFEKDTVKTAQNLLGKLIILHKRDIFLIGMIVETEAYQSYDEASHSFIGKTERNSAMFGPVGHAYVYINHGLHYGFNVVARNKKVPAGGVLIRAVEPLYGINYMQKKRNLTTTIKKIEDLTNGPGKFTQAFGITKKYNHHNLLTSDELFISKNIFSPDQHYTINNSPRIGISKAQTYLWRFFIANNPFVSYFKSYK